MGSYHQTFLILTFCCSRFPCLVQSPVFSQLCMYPGIWCAPLPVLLVSLLLSLLPVLEHLPFLVKLPLLTEDAFNTPAVVSCPLIILTKGATRSPPRLTKAHILVFGPALVNTPSYCSPRPQRLLTKKMKTAGPKGENPSYSIHII